MNGRFLFSVLVAGVVCVGCDTMKEELGLTRHTPDEFSVMQRAPLDVPSDLSTLPVPRPGAQRPQDVAAVTQAQQAVLGSEAVSADVASSAEAALINQVGAATPNIRQQIDAEAKVAGEDKRAVVKKIFNMGNATPSTIVDPAAEAKRIQDAKKAGQSVTTGETPTLQQ